MRNPEITRETILNASGELFNTRGYKATSISDITKATGLTKGAIYKHFLNKEALERETFKYLAQQVITSMRDRIKSRKTAGEKLEMLFTFFESYLIKPPVIGGCPLLNLAIESDDAHPSLRDDARTMLETLRVALVKILTNGIRYGQIKPEIDADQEAAVILASLEGGIMMSKLTNSNNDMQYILLHLRRMVERMSL